MVVAEQHKEILDFLYEVSDPEIPVLSIMDMGIVREVEVEGKQVKVTITPTYSGCPAMDVIGDDIVRALKKQGYEAKVKLVLAPAWTTDWITEEGRRKLEEYGIAAPLEASADKKALFKCEDCLEPFDYFKCL